jgi:hypothetical protein
MMKINDLIEALQEQQKKHGIQLRVEVALCRAGHFIGC